MVKRITFKTGPLGGKSYDVPAGTVRHDAAGGWYEIDGDTVKWRTSKAKADRIEGSKTAPASALTLSSEPNQTPK